MISTLLCMEAGGNLVALIVGLVNCAKDEDTLSIVLSIEVFTSLCYRHEIASEDELVGAFIAVELSGTCKLRSLDKGLGSNSTRSLILDGYSLDCGSLGELEWCLIEC